MAELRLEDVGKTFARSILAVDEISLTIASGEYVALLGPSGCGKSTLLTALSRGWSGQTEGDLFIDGINVNTLPPHRREVTPFFQRPAFILQQTVRQNLRPAWTASSPMRHFSAPTANVTTILRCIAHLLGIADDLERPVGQLSGGQQQRVALGRCLLRQAKGRCSTSRWAIPMRRDGWTCACRFAPWRELGLTMIHVTHDPAEVLGGWLLRRGDAARVHLQIDEPRQLRRLPNIARWRSSFITRTVASTGWRAKSSRRGSIPTSKGHLAVGRSLCKSSINCANPFTKMRILMHGKEKLIQ